MRFCQRVEKDQNHPWRGDFVLRFETMQGRTEENVALTNFRETSAALV
jgi:hypothetical protein